MLKKLTVNDLGTTKAGALRGSNCYVDCKMMCKMVCGALGIGVYTPQFQEEEGMEF